MSDFDSSAVLIKSYNLKVECNIASLGQSRGIPKLLKPLFDKYIEKGGKVLFKTKAKQLLVNKYGAVNGAIGKTKKDLLQINA
ncbi:hypothetical protein [Parasutterella sp.]|uniref:hypothetical protein n=1 Tax=Parasutterella sp. TaxID=2049037 RepID=UPI003520CFE5